MLSLIIILNYNYTLKFDTSALLSISKKTGNFAMIKNVFSSLLVYASVDKKAERWIILKRHVSLSFNPVRNWLDGSVIGGSRHDIEFKTIIM